MNYDVVLSAGVAALIVAAIYGLYLLRRWLQKSELRQLVEIYVGDAEMNVAGGKNKLEFVLTKIKAKYPTVDISLVRSMVEAAVVHLPGNHGSGGDEQTDASEPTASAEWR